MGWSEGRGETPDKADTEVPTEAEAPLTLSGKEGTERERFPRNAWAGAKSGEHGKERPFWTWRPVPAPGGRCPRGGAR